MSLVGIHLYITSRTYNTAHCTPYWELGKMKIVISAKQLAFVISNLQNKGICLTLVFLTSDYLNLH